MPALGPLRINAKAQCRPEAPRARGTQHSVRVKYDEHQELDVPEDRYRARGYQSPFDQLPWKGGGRNA